MTLRNVDTRDLRVGMYVIMPTSWDEHPFLKTKFQLTSRTQIDKIIRFGLTQVLVDPERSLPESFSPIAERERAAPVDPSPRPDRQDEAGKGIGEASEKLREAIHDRTLPTPEKAKIVRHNALIMMNSLLEQPTAKNIGAAKEAIKEIVELILTDDDAASCLTKITSYDFYT